MIPLRDETPTRSFPAVTLGIILVNIAVFLLEFAMGDDAYLLINQYSVIPLRLLNDLTNPAQLFTIISSMFLHAGWSHLVGNLFYLWIFGDNVEDRMGHLRFLLFYILCGLSATALHVFIDSGSGMPMIGASGAIAGVLGAYILLYPKARVRTLITGIVFFRTVYLPAFVVLGGWFALQLLNGWLALGVTTQTGGTAWFAHIGGFIAGMILLPIFRNRNIPPPPRPGHYYRYDPNHTRW